MFDFLRVSKAWDSKKQRYVYTPKFVIKSTIKDLMIRSRDFYAIFNEETGLWELDESKAIELIDAEIRDYATKDAGDTVYDEEHGPLVKLISDTDNRLIAQWHTFCQKDMRDTWVPLDQKIIFSNQTPVRADHATKKLSYPLQEGAHPAYDKLCSVWYLPDEQQKWEWFAGCGLAGDAKKIQKAIIFYGEPGTGKSSIAAEWICNGIFDGMSESHKSKKNNTGYAGSFDATALAQSKDQFGTDFLEDDPVIALDNEAEMSVINARGTFNKIISHESVRVNAKFHATYYIRPAVLLMMCANEPVQISPNSGLRRRILDVQPTGNLVDSETYEWCMGQIPFEKSAVAYKCLQVYKKLGPHYYDGYISEDMLNRTSPFQNFVAENYMQLKDGISLAAAYKLYSEYATECNFKNIMVRYKFRDTLKLYFDNYADKKFSGFKFDKIGIKNAMVDMKSDDYISDKPSGWLKLGKYVSILDEEFADCKAQYATDNLEHPLKYSWDKCPTKLKDLDTTKLHHLQPPDASYITIDFDIYNENGDKDLDLNIAAANKFPPTYAEVSKSGCGIHLEYKYTGGDPNELSRIFGENIEVKVYTGKSSLRRKLTKCNELPIATLSSGLPLKEVKKKVTEGQSFETEKKLINCIKKALRKGYDDLPSTKQNIDFIDKLLSEAYESGKTYDVRSLETSVLKFAMGSTNRADYCTDKVASMFFASKDVMEAEKTNDAPPDPANESPDYNSRPIIFLDIEIFPSYNQSKVQGVDVSDVPEDTPALFLVNWIFDNDDTKCVRMVNPKADEIKELFRLYRIIGFNNRNYDNHMLWACAQGYTPEDLYVLSGRLIGKDTAMSARFGQAYNVSYTDIYDLMSAGNKMGLKKWEIKLQKEGIVARHLEWNHPWNKAVPVKDWEKVAEYCDNDVLTTRALWHYLKDGDVRAREMLATMAKPYGGTMNSTTNQLTNMIVFEGEKNPPLVYTDFSTGKQYQSYEPFKVPILEWDDYISLGDDWTGVTPVNSNHFPGYHLVRDKKGKLHNMYRGVDVKFGGYVYATPGMYGRCVTKDVASMHPHSIKELNLFGEYTQNYTDLMDARIYIKHGDYEKAKGLFHGALAPYLTDKDSAKALSKALKTALNSAYGLTSASFNNAMRDSRNINNIVALRGALVMKTLQDEIEKRGFTVVHIKTDSIKIANPTDEILSFVDEFGKKYGYTYEVEHTWNRLCLVNDAVFIGQHDLDDPDYISNKDKSEEDFPSRWEAVGTQFKVPFVYKSLFTHQPIDFYDKCETINVTSGSLHLIYENGETTVDNFVGRIGLFCPMKTHGGKLIVKRDDGRVASPSGTKDYIWMESDGVKDAGLEDDINIDYYKAKCDEAIDTISKYGDYYQFTEVE